jgi:hypothetical protein
MKALISSVEPVNNFDGTSGFRIAEVEPDDKIFLVAPAFYWVDCPGDCVADLWYFDTADQLCKKKPEPEPTPVEVLP